MPEPNEYQIVLNLQTALLAITVVGGYHYDVAALAVKLDPNQDVEALLAPAGPRPFVVLEVKPERWEYFPASQLRLVLPVTIYWVHDSDPTVDLSRLRTYLRGCADVERAIAVDITRGGRAVDTRIVKRTHDAIGDGAQVWAVVDTEIITHRTFGAPDA
jgi:hypothetical protein